MKNSEIIECTVTDLGDNGEGIGRSEGMAVFIPGVLPEERVKAAITGRKKKFAFAKMTELLEKSPWREVPLCKVAEHCGGCQIQEMNYGAQLRWKQSHIENCITRIAKMPQVVVHPVAGMEEPWHFRNKAVYPVAADKEKVRIGFYELGTHQVVDAEGCKVLKETNGAIIRSLGELMPLYGIKPWSKHDDTGHVRSVVLRDTTEGQWMVALITAGNSLPKAKNFAAEMMQRHPEITTFLVNRNPYRDHRVYGPKTDVIAGEGWLEDTIKDLKFRISLESFFQVNPRQTEVLYGKALELAELSGAETVLDLYCGIGTISLYMAKRAKEVIGVEVVSVAVEDAKQNAERNAITNAQFRLGTAEEVLPQLIKEGIKPDVVVLDPPRKGCEQTALNAVIAMAPEKIIYVSCKPSTLARDLSLLAEGGYEAKEVFPVDMFPHTVHVEAIILMTRSGSGEKK